MVMRFVGMWVTMACSIAAAQSQESPQPAKPTFRAGAKLVLVPVVVRDRDGRAVGDLGQGSFQVFDKGRPQRIATFSVERAEARSAAPEHFIAYFFDDVTLNQTENVIPLREAALRMVANLKSGDRAAVFSSSCRLQVDFTAERARLQEAISRLQPNPIPICRVASTVPLQVKLLQAIVDRMSRLPGTRDIVAISAGFRVPGDRQEMRDDLIDQAVRAKVTIDALHVTDIRGSSTALSGALAGPHTRSDDPYQSAPVDPANLIIVAEGTGGAVIEADNSPDVGLRRLATPNCTYVLGFVPDGRADGAYHKLKVAVKDPRKLSVRAREGYFAAPAGSEGEVAPSPEPTAVTKAAPAAEPASPATASVKPAVEQPERQTRNQPVMFRSRTNLVLVPVVVRDTEGRAVGHLRKSDFELSDSGKRQEITSFSEENLAAPPGAEKAKAPGPAVGQRAAVVIPDRFTAYLFDDIHMKFQDLSRARDAVWRNIQESPKPESRIAVLTSSHRVMLDFTDELEKLHAALFRIQPTRVYRPLGEMSFMDAYKVTRGDRVALQQAMNALKGSTLDTGSALELYAEARSVHAVAAGEHESELSLHTIRDLSRRMASLAGRRTIVLLGHGFLVTDTLQGELAETLDRSIRSGVVIHTFNTYGLRTGMELPQSDDDTVGVYQDGALIAGAATLQTLAEGTGGTALENSNDYLGGVKRLAAPPEYRYVLGFEPKDLAADGKFHKLAVMVANRKYSVQTRRGYYAPQRGEGLTEAAAKEIENAVFSRDEVNDLPVTMRTEVSHAEGMAPELAVITDVDLQLLHFRKAQDRNCDDVTIVSTVFDSDGNFVAGRQLLLQLRLRDETFANLEQRKPETVKATFDLNSGTYLVRLVVRSAEAGTISATSTQVEIP